MGVVCARRMCCVAVHAAALLQGGSARENAVAASSYGRNALNNAAIVLQDARQAEGIKASDFFEEAMIAWTAIETAATATKSAHTSSRSLSSPSSSSSYASAAENYLRQTKYASSLLSDALSKAHTAQEAVSTFRTAQSQDRKVRAGERATATRVIYAVARLIAKSSVPPAHAATLAGMAVALAGRGRMPGAGKFVGGGDGG
ncbi:hypothetical protein B0O99DRAFT_692101 [Bisporella sp. PMI_857]|nr:hypothetical protein B0O99DRAFT_692101 [Bisporella sp. PMI_857]